MKCELDKVCGPLEYRWSIAPDGYKLLEIYRDSPATIWEDAQEEIDHFMKFAKQASLPLCVYLFPLDDSTWHKLSKEAVTVLRALAY